jgi:hypothetical protein
MAERLRYSAERVRTTTLHAAAADHLTAQTTPSPKSGL